jgi:methionine-gamma-lyase
MQKHSANALFLAENLQKLGIKVFYPGLPEHPHHKLMKKMMNPSFGFGGMMALDAGTEDRANMLMRIMQEEKIGYLAVSLGYFKTLFSAPGSSTSSEIPAEEQKQMGLSRGLIRLSVGLDHDIQRTLYRMEKCARKAELI